MMAVVETITTGRSPSDGEHPEVAPEVNCGSGSTALYIQRLYIDLYHSYPVTITNTLSIGKKVIAQRQQDGSYREINPDAYRKFPIICLPFSVNLEA
jgi:hypothetical protein